ncbi:hypothetical protein GCM10029963_32630 [Micromonospora andamanensis]
MTSTDDAKQAVRRRVWDLLEREAMAPPGVHGHIPDFTGKDDAAARPAPSRVGTPDKAQEMTFHALGVPGARLPHFEGTRHLIISPFCTPASNGA